MQFVDGRLRIAVYCQVAFVVVEVLRMVGQVDNGADGFFIVYFPDNLVEYIVGITNAVVVAVYQYFLV